MCIRDRIKTCAEPYREIAAEWDNLAAQVRTPWYKPNPMAQMLHLNYSRVLLKRDSAIARLDEFRIVLALKVYKQQHGAYPATLAKLQQTLSWQLPDDVFSGQPFRYQPKGEGFMLYSLGKDLDDDGGVREEDRKYQAGDIVWECAR